MLLIRFLLQLVVKREDVKLSSIRETLVLLENRNRKMFGPKNQEMKTGNSFIAMVINSGLTGCLLVSLCKLTSLSKP